MEEERAHYYFEYIPDALVHEPWNTYTSLLFFIPVFYWAYKLRGQYKEYFVLTAILPLIFLNGLGSTLWHANGRMVWGLLDALPPLVMMLFLAAYFWKLSIGKWWKGILIIIGFLGLNVTAMALMYQTGNQEDGVNIYYFVTGVMILTPIIYILVKRQGNGWQLILMTLLFAGAALLFRTLDKPSMHPFPESMPMGMHFLWHVFTTLAIFPLGRFLMQLQGVQKEAPQPAMAQAMAT